ncbi:hypothetical protein [Paraburkholderia sp. BR14320]|uniref:hypothetical protein n=1 Tax=unclassified Paraburkholderia TaxID=2615204 RepID=UPI0034CDB348
MSTATIQASEFSRLLVRAAKMLDRTGARTPEAIRKVVASSMQADIGQLPAKNQQRFAQSIALFAQGFDDALTAVADAAGELTPATKSGAGSSRRVPAQRGRSALHHRAGREPPRDFRRLHFLRKWSYGKHEEEVPKVLA